MKSRRRALFLALLLLSLGVAGGYFYLNAYHPTWVADLRAKFLGDATPEQTPTPVTAGSGMTTAQLRISWAEQALAEGRLKDADDHLKQAEELEPNTPATQALRVRINASWAEQALAEGRLKDADARLKQAEELERESAAIRAARAKLTKAEEAQRRVEEERRETTRRAEEDRVRKEEAAREAEQKKAALRSAKNALDANRPNEAERLARSLAEAGDIEAQAILGHVYHKSDIPQSLMWFRKAAEQNHADAQRIMGNSYRLGIEKYLEKDPAEAVRWYRKSAENGSLGGMEDFGITYCRGEGVEKNVQECLNWLKKAAEKEHASAQWALYLVYTDKLRGADLPEVKNRNEANFWLQKAAKNGDANAKKELRLRR